MTQKFTRYFFLIAFAVTSLFVQAQPLKAGGNTKKPEEAGWLSKLGEKIERGAKNVFNPEFIDKLKSGTKKIFSSESMQKAKDWCERHPGAALFGGSFVFGGMFHKHKLGFLLAAGGMAAGAVMELANQAGTPLGELFTKNKTPHTPEQE